MMRRMLASFLVFFAFAIFLQWRAGALVAEFSGSDEAAHFVTALMIHDYVASGMPAKPVKYAEEYYVRYPKVTFGIWPPLFHLSQAAWILVFSPTRLAVMLLMGLWTALLATGLYAAIRREFGFPTALALGMLLISLPEMQSSTNTDMPDVMMTCFMWAATLAFARFLDLEKRRDAVLFGVLASLGILVKYNALCLAMVPPFAILINRRFDLLRRFSFWLPVPVVAAICGPWYIYNRNLVKYAMEPNPGLAEIPGAVMANSATLVKMVGVVLFALFVVGAIAKLRPSVARQKGQSGWVCAAALFAATWVFHCILYAIDTPRYMLAAAPVMLMFTAAGCRAVAGWLAGRTAPRMAPASAVLLLAVCAYGATTFQISEKKNYGFSEATGRLLRNAAQDQQLVLVSGPAEIEGMVVSEMALADRNLRNCVLRASKVLAHSTWMGGNYESVFQTPEQVATFLKEVPVSTVVVDQTTEYNKPHHRLLRTALESDPVTWTPVNLGNTDTIRIYRRIGRSPKVGSSVYVDLSHTLGRSLVVPHVSSDRTQ